MAIKDRGSDADRQTHFDKWSGIVIQNYAVCIDSTKIARVK